jgi:hypothetical protein
VRRRRTFEKAPPRTQRNLPKHWSSRLSSLDAQRSARAAHLKPNLDAKNSGRLRQIKHLSDGYQSISAAAIFAGVESRAAARRLAAVQPLCKALFSAIIYAPVEPSLVKPAGSEALALGLAKFWTLQDVSAQALLSESFRNAFAVSVYLAAAQLYGAVSGARFEAADLNVLY